MTLLTRMILAIAITVASAIPALAEDRNYPDHRLTPGDTLPVTAADICVAGYARTAREQNHPISRNERAQVYAEYEIVNIRGNNELDHLISLELGGSNRASNLWPQPYHQQWNAHVKDSLENKLHDLVCAPGSPEQQQSRLVQAQHEIATDWIAAYKKYGGRAFGTRRPHQNRSYDNQENRTNEENNK